ncbi:hypothetical protein SEA_NANOSMITE_83 [Mycobacterium phage Nanosmite]|nr:hypothetical protein SEA_NANOSMITE_83 [Mycobacterium phage Nanosmite]
MSAGEVITTSSTGGQKAGNNVRMSLVPKEILEVAELYGKGAEKYDDHNWMLGYEWSKSFDALNRHLWEWWSGEEFDNGEGGTGLEHLTAVVFHALALMYFRKNHPDFDDRPHTVLAKRQQPVEDTTFDNGDPTQTSSLKPLWTRAYTWECGGLTYRWGTVGDRAGWFFRGTLPGDEWKWSAENSGTNGAHITYVRQ